MMTPVELRSVIGKRRKRQEEKVRLQILLVHLSTHLSLVLATCDLRRTPGAWASIEKEYLVLAFKKLAFKHNLSDGVQRCPSDGTVLQ